MVLHEPVMGDEPSLGWAGAGQERLPEGVTTEWEMGDMPGREKL